MHRITASLIACFLLSFLVGCPGPGTHDPGYVAKEWSTTIREFGIVPVFPPREDLAVGDIYLSPTPPDDAMEMRVVRHSPGQFLPIPVLVASMEVRQELDNYYKDRISFPPTPGTPSTQPAAILQPHGTGSIFLSGDNTRLRLGGFPEFFSAQISRGGVDGMIPTEAVNIAFGAFASANKQVRVSVPMVESYGLPAADLLQKLSFEDCHKTISIPVTGGKTIKLKGSDIQLLFAGQKYPPGNDTVAGYLRLITEVYATRAIDVSVQAENGGSGGANLAPTTKLLNKLPGFSAATQPASATHPAKGVAATEPANFDAPTPQQVASTLNNQLNESLQAALPGVSVKFLSVTAYGVSMRRTYERPVVIGYRAILLAVKKDQVIEVAGVSSSVIPVNTLTSTQQLALEKELSDELTAGLRPKFGDQASATVLITPGVDSVPTKVHATIVGVPDPQKQAAAEEARSVLSKSLNARRDKLPGSEVGSVLTPD